MPNENKVILTDEEKKIILDELVQDTKSQRSKINLLSQIMEVAGEAMKGIETINQETLDHKASAEKEIADKQKLVTIREKYCAWLTEAFAE